jgi:hypothetical protein
MEREPDARRHALQMPEIAGRGYRVKQLFVFAAPLPQGCPQ